MGTVVFVCVCAGRSLVGFREANQSVHKHEQNNPKHQVMGVEEKDRRGNNPDSFISQSVLL